jgi:hypothetical protein
MTSPARRALALFIEPDATQPTERSNSHEPALYVGVTGLSRGCGTSTIAHGLRRELPAARVIDGGAPAPTGVLVVVAGRAGLPVLARLVTDLLRERHTSVVLVANHPEDPREWERAGAVCVPQSRMGVLLLSHGRRARGPFGSALREVARAVRESGS